MLKSKFLLFSFLVLSVATFAQEMKDIFERDTKITWLGLDLTAAKLIGDRERFGSTSDVMHLMESWNDIMIKERDKFNVRSAIQKDAINEAFDVTKEHNASLDISEIFSNDDKDHMRLRQSDVEAIVADYDFKGNSGIGVMFNVESFSKKQDEALVWITFVNMDTKEVFFTERLSGQPGGAGLRNYWANAVYDIITKMRRKEFENWRKKYYRKF
ncbi:MAG TPA: hypothetical protein VGD40_13670 [Chryseosolibacter sp.]